jgi:hypothetical protein
VSGTARDAHCSGPMGARAYSDLKGAHRTHLDALGHTARSSAVRDGGGGGDGDGDACAARYGSARRGHACYPRPMSWHREVQESGVKRRLGPGARVGSPFNTV